MLVRLWISKLEYIAGELYDIGWGPRFRKREVLGRHGHGLHVPVKEALERPNTRAKLTVPRQVRLRLPQ